MNDSTATARPTTPADAGPSTNPGNGPVAAAAPADRRILALAALAGAVTLVGAVATQVATGDPAVAKDLWSYPWSERTHVLLSVAWAATHILVFLGLAALCRSELTGPGRMGAVGYRLARAGTAVLAVAEIASLWAADATDDSGRALATGAVFGIGTLLIAAGFLAVGVATRRAGSWPGAGGWTPLVVGLGSVVLVALAPTDAGFVAIALHGVTLLALFTAATTRA